MNEIEENYLLWYVAESDLSHLSREPKLPSMVHLTTSPEHLPPTLSSHRLAKVQKDYPSTLHHRVIQVLNTLGAALEQALLPIQQIKIRFRIAQILFQYTEEYKRIEDHLGKAIALSTKISECFEWKMLLSYYQASLYFKLGRNDSAQTIISQCLAECQSAFKMGWYLTLLHCLLQAAFSGHLGYSIAFEYFEISLSLAHYSGNQKLLCYLLYQKCRLCLYSGQYDAFEVSHATLCQMLKVDASRWSLPDAIPSIHLMQLRIHCALLAISFRILKGQVAGMKAPLLFTETMLKSLQPSLYEDVHLSIYEWILDDGQEEYQQEKWIPKPCWPSLDFLSARLYWFFSIHYQYMNPELAMSYIQKCRADLQESQNRQDGSLSENERRRHEQLENAFLFQEIQCFLFTNKLEDCERRLSLLYARTIQEEALWRPVYLLLKATIEQTKGDYESAFEWWNILIQNFPDRSDLVIVAKLNILFLFLCRQKIGSPEEEYQLMNECESFMTENSCPHTNLYALIEAISLYQKKELFDCKQKVLALLKAAHQEVSSVALHAVALSFLSHLYVDTQPKVAKNMADSSTMMATNAGALSKLRASGYLVPKFHVHS